MGIFHRLPQLFIQMVLHEEMQRNTFIFRRFRRTQLFYPTLFPNTLLTPLGEVGGVIFVAEETKDRIGLQPEAVLRVEVAILLRGEGLSRIFFVQLFDVAPLQGDDRLVIDETFLLQFSLLGKIFLLILQLSHPFDVQVHRVQCENGYGAIGVRVPPRPMRGSVVDRQGLDDALSCLRHPIRQRFQVQELPAAEAVAGAQREDRHRRTRPSERREVELRLLVVDHNQVGGEGEFYIQETVPTILP